MERRDGGATLTRAEWEVVTAQIAPDTNRQLELLAQVRHTSKASIIRCALEEYLKRTLAAAI